MNVLDTPTVTRSQFRKALNIRCHKEFGIGLNDLPDIICLDDVWWEGITEKESVQMIDGCIEDFREDFGEPFQNIDTGTYTSIDE